MAEAGVAARPKLLVLASTYPRFAEDPEPGFVHELSRRLTQWFNVIALVPSAPGARAHEVLDGVEVIRYRYAPSGFETLVNNGGIPANLRRHPWKWALVPGFLAAQLLIACRLLRTRNIQVIHAHWLIPQGLVAALLSRRHPPVLVTCHGADVFGFNGTASAAKRFAARRAAAIATVSSAMRDKLATSGVPRTRISVLPMGADLAARFTAEDGPFRSKHELLFVGRLVPKKGVHHLIAALPSIAARQPLVRLRIAGFGPEENAIRQLAAKLGVLHRIIFAGAVPNAQLPELYRRAALLVAPFVEDKRGEQDGLPVVLIEALGCGCPVIAGDVAGTAELFDSERDTVCVDATDIAALSGRIVTALEQPERCAQVARRLAAQIRQRYDWQAVAQSYADQLLALAASDFALTAR
jgi:glycosyltransferase involved in cell wall biosynthesis